MYTLCLKRTFRASHFLVAADSGDEALPHSHPYTAELRIRGERLDDDGYLVDLRRVEAIMDEAIAAYRDRLLNDLPEFQGRNPSLEHFCRVLAERIGGREGLGTTDRMEVRLWESEAAWASWSEGN